MLHVCLDTLKSLALLYVIVKLCSLVLRVGIKGLIKVFADGVLGSVGKVVPGIMDVILKKAIATELIEIEKSLLGDGDPEANISIPITGISSDNILDLARSQKDLQEKFKNGTKWGGIYHDEYKVDGDHLSKLQSKLWQMFNNSNCLYPDIFPGIRKFEAEITQMVGGTESIMLAVLAYREQGLNAGIKKPEIIASITAHPALYKACKYFQVKLVKVNTDVRFQKVNVFFL
eukprot:GSMAST32.ASY1.ANO1.2833.1 assembled CDS